MSDSIFDQLIDRRQSGSLKWKTYDADVIPMWVADMDFRAPEEVLQALHERVDHGVFGYEWPSRELKEVVCERMQRLYRWVVTPEQVHFLPGVVAGFNLACRAAAKAGESVLTPTPVYPPILKAPPNHSLKLQAVEMLCQRKSSNQLHYEIDFDALAAAINPSTRLFLLCHPQNPTGREFTREELLRLAAFCARNKILICSDEIHCDLLLGGTEHVPLAALAPEISSQCITLMAPSKTYNIPGLGCSFAIIQNAELRKRYIAAGEGLLTWVNALGLAATQAAYRRGETWLKELLRYLTGNRDFMAGYLAEHLPQLRTTVPEATYLAWIDCRELPLTTGPQEFFLKEAKVASNDGVPFGPGGKGFVRLNFGCPRSRLVAALDNMRAAVDKLKTG